MGIPDGDALPPCLLAWGTQASRNASDGGEAFYSPPRTPPVLMYAVLAMWPVLDSPARALCILPSPNRLLRMLSVL